MYKLLKSLNKYKYFHDDDFALILGDSLELLKKIDRDSIDMIFADPPYFLSNDGITCMSGRMVSVNKGNWDKSSGVEENFKFNLEWLGECRRILKKDGTVWVSGTSHIIYSIGYAMQLLGYKILNDIIWYKRNAPPNLSCRYFTHSTEIILWAAKSDKSKHYFDYKKMKELNKNKQMRNIWDIKDAGPENLWEISAPGKKEKEFGKHPTQKPEELLKRIVLASTKEDDIILDPFNGSGTTGIVASRLNRKYIGIDNEKEYLDLTIKRYKKEKSLLELLKKDA
ncbi:MAG: site-specific DNA-methyltransferase [Actinomycetota bacterium]|nr:site-specific DNA-methyltransferase [Actinomycetota bacterium]